MASVAPVAQVRPPTAPVRTRFRRDVAAGECAFHRSTTPVAQSRAHHAVDGSGAARAPRSTNRLADRASRTRTQQTRFGSAKSQKVVARRAVVARAVAEAEAKPEKPKRKFVKKNVTVQDADIAVGNKYEGKVVRHPSETLSSPPVPSRRRVKPGKRGSRGASRVGSGPAPHVSFRGPTRPNPAASGLRRCFFLSSRGVGAVAARAGLPGWAPRFAGFVGRDPNEPTTARGTFGPSPPAPVGAPRAGGGESAPEPPTRARPVTDKKAETDI